MAGSGRRPSTAATLLSAALTLCVIWCSSVPAATITVKADGGGDYTSIQPAIDAASQFDVIEVQDSATYAGNLAFAEDVSDLTLRAAAGENPVIQLSGLPANGRNIDVAALNTTIAGFKITFAGTPNADNRMIQSVASGTVLQDCIVVGDGGVVYGIVNVDDVENVEVSNCSIGLYFEGGGLDYDAIGCHGHDCSVSSLFAGGDCNVVVTDALLENSAQNVIASGADHNLLIQNSIMRNATARNLDLKGPYTANCITTVEDSMILGGASDCILQYSGTLNLNYTIIAPANQAAIVMYGHATVPEPGICNVDHCTIAGSDTQWACYTFIHADHQMTITNSIITGPQGLYQGTGTITSDYNNIFSAAPYSGAGPAAGADDFLSDPMFMQTTEPNVVDFYRVSGLSAAAIGDDSGGYCGAAGFVPAGDLNLTLSVDMFDFAEMGQNWQGDFVTTAGTDTTIEDFEIYVDPNTYPDPNVLSDSWAVSPFNESPGNAAIDLIDDPLVAFEGSKAITWDYNTVVAVAGDQVNSEILLYPAAPFDLSGYDEVSLWVYRQPGNVRQQDMYIWFYNWCSDSTICRESYTIQGNTDTPAGVWQQWRFSLHDNIGYAPGFRLEDLTNIEAFGIGTRTEIGTLGGSGTLILDKIQVHTVPECAAGFPIGDIDENCFVDLSDLYLFGDSWLQTTE